jgi:hypothetical protein
MDQLLAERRKPSSVRLSNATQPEGSRPAARERKLNQREHSALEPDLNATSHPKTNPNT